MIPTITLNPYRSVVGIVVAVTLTEDTGKVHRTEHLMEGDTLTIYGPDGVGVLRIVLPATANRDPYREADNPTIIIGKD